MKNLRAHIFLLLVNLIYGANYTIAKVVMTGGYIKPFGFILIRVSCAMVLFFTVHRIFIKEKIDKADIPRLILCGIFGVALNQLMFFKGLSYTYPINAALMMITTPILVMIIAAISLKEPITKNKWLGAILGAVGCAIVITYGKKVSFGGETVLGDFLVLINATSYGIYLVLVKPLMKKYNPITVITYVFIFGFFPVLIFGYQEFSEIQWDTFTDQVWMALAYVVIFTTFFAYLLNILALKDVSPTVVGGYIYLQPVISGVIAILAGVDSINQWKIIGGLIIFLGVYLVTRQKPLPQKS